MKIVNNKKNLPPVVEIGEGVTEGIGSDAYPYTVIEVKRNGRQLVIQSDDYEVVSGNTMDGSAEYEITPNPDGATRTINWKPSRNSFGDGVFRYSIGHRRVYRDPHF